jgi:hypothetical protein
MPFSIETIPTRPQDRIARLLNALNRPMLGRDRAGTVATLTESESGVLSERASHDALG